MRKLKCVQFPLLENNIFRYCKHRSKHPFCYMARAGTTKHLNMLFGGKIYVWRYVSPYYLLEFTTFADDHDPNASLSCAFTWKPLNCRLNCNNCYSEVDSNHHTQHQSSTHFSCKKYFCEYSPNLLRGHADGASRFSGRLIARLTWREP